MKPEYAELIEAMDLGSETPEAAAERLEITRNNPKVRHHRARQQLRAPGGDLPHVCPPRLHRLHLPTIGAWPLTYPFQ